MRVPTQDELVGQIAARAGAAAARAEQILADQGVLLVPVPPVTRSIELIRLTFSGSRTGTRWDGSFEETFDFGRGVTAFITNENLRGKSSVLELVTWALRGRPRDLRSDVQPWFDLISLEYSINGTPMAVVLVKTESGFTADIIRAKDSLALREYLMGDGPADSVNVIASSLSESQFASVQDETMMTLLGFDPITNFQKFKGSDDGVARANTWPAYYGGIHLPRNSEILFGDTVFAGLPARILQMYCNVPLMGTYIRLSTLVRVQKQNEANIVRRANEDAIARADERDRIKAELSKLDAQIEALPSGAGRSAQTISADLREAEQDLEVASASSREASRTVSEARSARQNEEVRTNNERETQLAGLLFHGLNPSHCPRCEQKIEAKRTQREASSLECAVCTNGLDVYPAHQAHGEDEEDSLDELNDTVAPLEALRRAEEAAVQSLTAASVAVDSARLRVDTLAAELVAASQAEDFTDRLSIQLEKSRLQGRLEGFAEDAVVSETSETIRVLEAALVVLKGVTAEAATQLFAELDEEIVAIGRRLGIDNLEEVQLQRDGGMSVVTAGVRESFKGLSGGERVRLRVAVVMALLRVGHRSGVGSHPGLVLLDSPGDELTIDAEATLLHELDSLKDEIPTLQILVASDEPAAVMGHIPDEHIYSSLDGTPLW